MTDKEFKEKVIELYGPSGSTVPSSVAGDDYQELRAQIGDQTSTFYGPHACPGCAELIVKRAIEQGGEAFTFPKLPGDKYEPHICDPAVEVVKPQGWLVPMVVDLVSRTQPVDIRKHPFVVSVRHLLDHMRSEPKHAALATLLDDCEQQYKNLSRENNHGEVPTESD